MKADEGPLVDEAVLPGDDARHANAYVSLAIVTNMGHARNVILAHTAAALIAVEGEYGTLSEIAFAMKCGIPIVGLNTWKLTAPNNRPIPMTHASTPEKGINALLVGSELLVFLSEQLRGRFPSRNPLFDPERSTFEPTKRLANVENVNTIPGEDVTFFDVRLLPEYDIQECVEAAQEVARIFEQRTGAVITVEAVRVDPAGQASRADGEGAKALSKAVRRVLAHIVAETAQHAGHADIIRESIDGHKTMG